MTCFLVKEIKLLENLKVVVLSFLTTMILSYGIGFSGNTQCALCKAEKNLIKGEEFERVHSFLVAASLIYNLYINKSHKYLNSPKYSLMKQRRIHSYSSILMDTIYLGGYRVC